MAAVGGAVVEAASCGDLDGVKVLLKNKALGASVINGTDKDGRSALHYACLNDTKELVKLLLADPRVDVDLRSPKGDSCLHLASLYASLESMQLLFADARGKKLLDASNQWGETPLHLCAGSGDKKAEKAALLLLEHNASLLCKDKWGRGPMDVALDNGENPLKDVFGAFLARPANKALKAKVDALSAEYQQSKQVKVAVSEETKKLQGNLFLAGGLGAGLKGLKKTETTVKTMFSNTEGRVTDQVAIKHEADAKSSGKVLSKMVEFPGDVEEIRKLLADAKVDPAGADAYGICAVHKFSAWNKTELLDMLLPKLSKEQVNARDKDGKTALHMAVEMASVAAITTLVASPKVDASVKDEKGRTPLDIITAAPSTGVTERVKKALLKQK